MTHARWVNLALIGTYLVLAVLYGVDREYARMSYWIGAAIIAGSVLVMP